jgi:hypothetical protein
MVSGKVGSGGKDGIYLSAVSAHVRTVRPEVSEALMSAPASRASWTAEALPSDAAWRRAKFSKERCGRLIAGRQWCFVRGGGRRRRREVRRVDIVNLSRAGWRLCVVAEVRRREENGGVQVLSRFSIQAGLVYVLGKCGESVHACFASRPRSK